VLTAGLVTAAVGLLLLSFLSVPYLGLIIFPFGAGVAFSAATVAAMKDVRQEQAALAGALVNTAMETGPPLGTAALTWIANVISRHPATGYPFALRTAAALLLATALFTVKAQHASQSKEDRKCPNGSRARQS
jgi:hypothetical protein